MNTVAISKKEYKTLLQRQRKVEEELDIVKSLLKQEIEEEQIQSTVLKRWERISHDLDRGQKHIFSSTKSVLAYLKHL